MTPFEIVAGFPSKVHCSRPHRRYCCCAKNVVPGAPAMPALQLIGPAPRTHHGNFRFTLICVACACACAFVPPTALQLGGLHSDNVFTGIAFETVYPDDPAGRRVFVASEQGSILQIHGPTKELQVIYKVHSGPITSILVNESFCVTGVRQRCHSRPP